MTEKNLNDPIALDRLAETLIDDILNMTDEEILAEVKADGDDPERVAQETRGIFERAIMNFGKLKLLAAKKAVISDRQKSSKVSQIDPSAARQKLDRILKKNPKTLDKLTLAARKGEGLSDSDVLSMLQDLEELGIEEQDDNE